MEFILSVLLMGIEEKDFLVYRQFSECVQCRNSIIIVDYKWTPWFRKEGNLLW
jgi:hypothetical protein